ncbi:MAG: hypothetical protein ACO2PN_23455 [Pyrobaculum sp.]
MSRLDSPRQLRRQVGRPLEAAHVVLCTLTKPHAWSAEAAQLLSPSSDMS